MKHFYVGQRHKQHFLEINVYSKIIQTIEMIEDGVRGDKKESSTKAIKIPNQAKAVEHLTCAYPGCSWWLSNQASVITSVTTGSSCKWLTATKRPQRKQRGSALLGAGVSIQTPFLRWARSPIKACPGPSFSRVYPKASRCSGNWVTWQKTRAKTAFLNLILAKSEWVESQMKSLLTRVTAFGKTSHLLIIKEQDTQQLLVQS